jgi:hypothetical protein
MIALSPKISVLGLTQPWCCVCVISTIGRCDRHTWFVYVSAATSGRKNGIALVRNSNSRTRNGLPWYACVFQVVRYMPPEQPWVIAHALKERLANSPAARLDSRGRGVALLYG